MTPHIRKFFENPQLTLIIANVELMIVSMAAFMAAVLTFFSGFGLGTLLMPVFALFFPLDVSIALTAIVHFLNNFFKLFLVGKFADRQAVVKFGFPAIVAAALGAWLLTLLTDVPPLWTYAIGGKSFYILWVKVVIAVIIIGFTIFELIPFLKTLTFNESHLAVGGVLSGFFGGLSGHQGALRSAFLARLHLSKESFIGTGVVIACLIDAVRMGIYSVNFATISSRESSLSLIFSTSAAFIGTYLGSVYLKKVTMKFIQKMMAVVLIVMAVALMVGLI